MKNLPLISVIVPTFNSAEFLDACLQSVKHQTYQNIELIVVDNFSTDNTKEIARKYTNKVFSKGFERSAQRNYGVEQSKGAWVAIVDSDMELTKNTVRDCVEKIASDNKIKGIIIPEESFGKGFWAQCKKLERSFYVGIGWMEAARFFDRAAYEKAGGYNEALVSGEDWDLSQRIETHGHIGRINSYILHNEGNLKLTTTLHKKYYYAKKFARYLQGNSSIKISQQIGIPGRYMLYFSQPKRLFRNPLIAIGMLFMKTCELGVGAIGFITGRMDRAKK